MRIYHLIFFDMIQDSTLTFSQILIDDTSLVPVPRRDAAISVIDQVIGSISFSCICVCLCTRLCI